MARDKALGRVSLACQLDMPVSIEFDRYFTYLRLHFTLKFQIHTGANDMKQSSSHVDVCHIVEQVACHASYFLILPRISRQNMFR